jgi:hypothetical protein
MNKCKKCKWYMPVFNQIPCLLPGNMPLDCMETNGEEHFEERIDERD